MLDRSRVIYQRDKSMLPAEIQYLGCLIMLRKSFVIIEGSRGPIPALSEAPESYCRGDEGIPIFEHDIVCWCR
jgi:hypothetical protein